MNKDKQGTAYDAVLIDKDGTMCRMRCGANRQRKEGGRRNMLNHANKVSGHGNSPQRVSGRWNPNARDERTLTERNGDDSPIGLLSKERANPWARRGIFISMGERAYTKRAAKLISGSLCIYSCERVFLVYSLSQLVLSMRR